MTDFEKLYLNSMKRIEDAMKKDGKDMNAPENRMMSSIYEAAVQATCFTLQEYEKMQREHS